MRVTSTDRCTTHWHHSYIFDEEGWIEREEGSAKQLSKGCWNLSAMEIRRTKKMAKRMIIFYVYEHEEEGSFTSYTSDGTVDFYGKPAMKDSTGGWSSATLLLVNQGMIALAFSGVEANLVIFSKLVLKQTNVEAANTFSLWMGTTYFFSLIGAFLSDSYLGRYLTCILFQFLLIIGLVVLSLSTHFFLPRGCESDTQDQFPLFYLSIYLIALGSGVSDPALPTLCADQFDEEEPKEQRSKALIYGYFYVALNLGSLVAETILAYIGTTGHW
ncbi:hypothetical protein TSUD_266570, partial [Trifolium subterraneum]